MAQNKPEERQPLLKEQNNQALLSMGTAEGEKKKGLPIRGKTLAVVCAILMTELCERLTYYSVIANLVLFCTSELELSSSLAATVSLVFSGTSYIIPVFGGYIADAVAGKYNTILGAGMLYLLGLFLIPASAVDYSAWFSPAADGTEYNLSVGTRRAYFLIGLAFVAIGTGGIKANVGPFGAQQVTDLGPEAVQSFFNWFYWFINAGSMVAYAGVAYIQQNISFSYGFLVPLISMIIALIIFVFAKKHYVITPPGGSILGDAMGVIAGTGCKSFNRSRKSEGGKYSDEMVDGVIAVTRIIPIFLFFIMYWAVYSQMQSTFFLQSERMDVKIGHVVMPVAALNVFNTIIILVLIPIVDRGLYPCFAKMGMKLNHLHRIGIGMVLASLSVVVAGILEIYRKQELAESGGFNQTLSGDTFNASSYSVFLQVPEFALVGASEVFSSISGLEFAYSQAPDFMQGLVMGLFLLMSGLGNYVSNLILVIVQAFSKSDPWFPDEINEGKAEYLFFFIGGLMLLNFFGFVVAAKFYKYREFKRADDIEKEVEFTQSENPKNPYMNGHDNLSYENSDVTKL